MLKKIKGLLIEEEGQGMTEYGLILGLIALAVVGALIVLGPKIASIFNNVNDNLTTK